jgi:hypothetical protein
VLSVGLLAVAVSGGIYLSRDRDSQQRTTDTATTTAALEPDQQRLKELAAAREAEAAKRLAAETEAAAKALAAARAAAERARLADEAASRKKAERDEPGTGRTPPFTGPIPKSCGEFSGNRKIGCALMLQRGFPIKEFPCLNKLWNHESGWNHRARNRSSGAYGIAQALPGSKMASVAADWRTNPATQIKWGLGYLKGRYKSPCGGWGHFQRNGWY